MNMLQGLLNGKKTGNNIFPLFWQHAEDEETLRREIQQMKSVGLDGFIVESRPHPDFLGARWWQDLDIIIDEAKKHNMRVWIFDDSAYPSGFSAGLIKKNNPELVKKYIREDHIDAFGPLKGASFIVNQWYSDDEELLAVVAARRADGENAIDSSSLVDITDNISDGILYWDLPAGPWRIFMFTSTNKGGEEWTKDYLNPLQGEAVKAYINYVYEPHYNRYSKEFGKTFAGFFTDESRFGSCGSYEAILGKFPMVVPYKDGLLDILSEKWSEEFTKYLPLLWYNKDELSVNAKYTYMDTVSSLFAENFQMQIGDWCRAHGVKSIGHIVEDNGAHARLGLGAGHFYRVLRGQDYSGFDIVYHAFPEYMGGKYNSPFGVLDADFFYWGISKMAVSESHIDPKKNGVTVCEIFGAYGWQEGLKLMKWLTDHICVRGANVIIPHAFSPKYPDGDCPPHFYAQGHNPQWKDFGLWSSYATRLCTILKGGLHKADVAVLYHADAEWAGESQPFEKIVKCISQNQIDCDVIPADAFYDYENYDCYNGKFRINKEEYGALLIPYSEFLPERFLNEVFRLAENGITVVFAEDYPSAAMSGQTLKREITAKLKSTENVFVSSTDGIPMILKNKKIANDISISSPNKYFRHYHYINDGMDIYFLTNESKYFTFDETVKFPFDNTAILYDAMENKVYNANQIIKNGSCEIRIVLEPYESVFVVFGSGMKSDAVCIVRSNLQKIADISGEWKVSKALSENYPNFVYDSNIKGLGNVSDKNLYPKFSGIIRYETSFDNSEICDNAVIDIGEAYETVTVFLNGKNIGTKICPPYIYDVTSYLKVGKNDLKIEVTNTLAKAKGNNHLDRYMAQEPSGLMGPVSLNTCKK